MRILKLAMWSFGVVILTAATASADVQLSIADGRVSLTAKDATVRQILAEWARVGQTRIVNGERVPGGPVTLELHNVPEAQALETLLRAVSGFMAAPRVTPVANASRFDRIVVMPTSTAPPAAPVRNAGPGAVFPQPVYPQQPGQPGGAYPGAVATLPQPVAQPPAPTDDDVDDENPAPPAGRGPVFNGFPPPQVTNPQQQGGAQTPGVASTPGQMNLPPGQSGTPGQVTPVGGVSTPGMIVQPPQPNQPGVPNQPRKPGGPGGDDDPR